MRSNKAIVHHGRRSRGSSSHEHRAASLTRQIRVRLTLAIRFLLNTNALNNFGPREALKGHFSGKLLPTRSAKADVCCWYWLFPMPRLNGVSAAPNALDSGMAA